MTVSELLENINATLFWIEIGVFLLVGIILMLTIKIGMK